MESRLISNKDFSVIQERIINCILPINAGRTPRKIASAFHSLTTDEWKNWTLLFSLMVLHDILPPDHRNYLYQHAKSTINLSSHW